MRIYYFLDKYLYIRYNEILKKWGFPIYHDWSTRNEPIAKRVANATIKIAPYKKHPELYNIWFDDVAIGIQLVYIHFAN